MAALADPAHLSACITRALPVLALAIASLIGCGGRESPSDSRWPLTSGAIEFQIAVRSTPYRSGDPVPSGDHRLVVDRVLPLPSDRGPGKVVSACDGVYLEMQWSGLEANPYGPGVMLVDFRWRLANRIVAGGDAQGFGLNGVGAGKKQSFLREFDHLMTPWSYGGNPDGPICVLRARWIEAPHPWPDIRIDPPASAPDKAEVPAVSTDHG